MISERSLMSPVSNILQSEIKHTHTHTHTTKHSSRVMSKQIGLAAYSCKKTNTLEEPASPMA